MTRTTITPHTNYVSRPLPKGIDDATIISNFYQGYKSLEFSEQLWAIDQIPLSGVSGGPLAVLQCFQYFCENLNLDETEVLKALHAAISRELIIPVLNSVDRFKFVLPITIQCYKVNIPGKWIHLLHRICKMIKNSYQQSNAFEKASDLIKECNYYSGICAAHMIAGLCEAGATVPNSIVNQLIDHPQIFELCYTPILNWISSNSSFSYANKVIEQLLHTNPPEGPLLQASLSIQSKIPEPLKNWIKSVLVDNPNPSTDVVSAIAKYKNRLIHQDIFTEQQIMQIVWSSGLFTPQYFDAMFEYFQKALPFMKESDSLSFLKRICQSESPHSIKICVIFLKTAKLKQSIQYAVDFLSSPRKSYSEYQEFVKLFDTASNIVSSEHSNSLTQCLLNLLSNEIRIGHIVGKDGTKFLSEIDIKKAKKITPTFVKGWREMSQMIEALSCSPSKKLLKEKGIPLIQEALTVHSNPLIPSISTFLSSLLDYQDAIFDFFDFLLNGGSSKQIILIEIIQRMMKKIDIIQFFNTIGLQLSKLAITNSPINVKIAILKLFPKFLYFGKDFINSKLITFAVSMFHKFQNELKIQINDFYLNEVLDSLKNDYTSMERVSAKRSSENIDLSNVIKEPVKKPLSCAQKRIVKRSKSIGIRAKPSSVTRPIPSHSKLLPHI